MSVSRLTGVELVGFLLLQYSSGVARQPGALQMSQHIIYVKSSPLFLYRLYLRLSVARNDSWMSYKTSTRSKQIYICFHYYGS